MTVDEIDFSKKYYYNSRLKNPGEKELYRFIVERILKREYKFIYTFAYYDELLPDELKSLPCFEYKEFTQIGWIYDIYDAIIYDFPEFYYIKLPVPSFDEEHSQILDMSPFSDGARYSDEEIEKYDKQLDELYHKFDKYQTGFELERAVNDYIIEHYEYATQTGEECMNYEKEKSASIPGERRFHEIFTVVGLLEHGEAVCAGISKLAQYIFARRGMESVILYSTPENYEETSHAWLAVKLEGKFYHLDITFGESGSKVPYAIQYDEFNTTDRERMKSVTGYCPEKYPEIVCKSKKNNFFYHEGLYFKTKKEVKDGFLKFARDNRVDGKSAFFYFRVSGKLRKSEVLYALSAANREAGRINGSYIKQGSYYTVELYFMTEEEAATKKPRGEG